MGVNFEYVNFGKYLEKTRKNHGVTIEELSEGICDFSLITKIESGERVSSVLLRDRLLERIGATSDEYEKYVKTQEFIRYKKRKEIIAAIEHLRNDYAFEKLNEYYDSILEDRIFEEQFCLEIRAMLENTAEKKFALVEEALRKTVKVDKSGIVLQSRLSPREINLVVEYSYGLQKEKRRIQLEQLLGNVDKQNIEKRNLVLFYPKLVFVYINEFLDDNVDNHIWLTEALDRIEKSEEILESTKRLIYIIELNSIKDRICRRIKEFSNDADTCDNAYILEEDSCNSEFIWKKFGDAYGHDLEMRDWCYMYHEEGIRCVADIIKKRRKMLGMSKEAVCMDICSIDTLERIEKMKSNPKTQKMLKILTRLGLSGEYQKTIVAVENAEIKACEELAMLYSNTGRYEECLQELDKLNRLKKNKTAEDEQFILMTGSVMKYRMGIISSAECEKALEKALEFTLKGPVSYEDVYMTRAELSCIYNIVLIRKGAVNDKIAKFVMSICDLGFAEMTEKDVRVLELYLLAAVMISLNRGDIQSGEKYNRMLIEMELLSRRRFLIYKAILNNEKICKLKQENGEMIPEDVILLNTQLAQGLKPYRLNKQVG